MSHKFNEIQKWMGKEVSVRLIEHELIPESQILPWEGNGRLRNCSHSSITIDLEVPLPVPTDWLINVVPPWDGRNFTVPLQDVELEFDSNKKRILLVIERPNINREFKKKIISPLPDP